MEEETKIPQKPKRIILDIGMGRFPFVAGWKQRKLSGDEVYIGVEPKEDIGAAARLVQEPGIVGEGKAFFLKAWGERLPFADESVDEVVVSNLIGHKKGAHTIPRETISSIVLEAGRVLKMHGKVVVVETLTPAPRQEVVDFFNQSGFVLAREVRRSDNEEESEKEIEKFYNPGNANDKSYLMEFVKNPN